MCLAADGTPLASKALFQLVDVHVLTASTKMQGKTRCGHHAHPSAVAENMHESVLSLHE